MKDIVIILLLVLVFNSCNTGSEAKISHHNISKEEIEIFLNTWHKDAASVKMEAYFDKFADSGVFIGTDVTEHWTKQEFYYFALPFFQKKQTWDFYSKNRNIFFSKDSSIIWFDEVLDTWMGECRSSGVIQHYSDTLKIEHYQVSVTVPNNKMAAFLKLMNENGSDSIADK